MSTSLRVILILVCIFTLISIVNRARKSKLKITYSMFWISVSLFLIVISIFPSIVYFFADVFGIQSPANLVYLLIIFILFIDNFHLTVKLSHVEDMVQNLTGELAVRRAMNTDAKHEKTASEQTESVESEENTDTHSEN